MACLRMGGCVDWWIDGSRMLGAGCSILAAGGLLDCWIGGLVDERGQGVGCRVSGGPHVDRSSWPPAIAPVAVGMADPPPSTAVVKSTMAVKEALWRTGSSLRRSRAAEKKLFSP